MPNDDSPLDLETLLNPEEQARFRRLCLETAADDLQQLSEIVDIHLDQIRGQAGAVTDVDTAGAIASSLSSLLSDVTVFDAEERALVRGAVEYFLLADDASGDLDDPLGFDDDARVLNATLDRIGRVDLRVELD